MSAGSKVWFKHPDKDKLSGWYLVENISGEQYSISQGDKIITAELSQLWLPKERIVFRVIERPKYEKEKRGQVVGLLVDRVNIIDGKEYVMGVWPDGSDDWMIYESVWNKSRSRKATEEDYRPLLNVLEATGFQLRIKTRK